MTLERTSSRPNAPSPALLEEASRTISRRFSASLPMSWRVVRTLERPTSTLFQLEARSDGRFLAYYKASYFPARWTEETRLSRITLRRTALSMGSELNHLVGAALEQKGVHTPELLALSLDELATIHLQLPGSPLKGGSWFYPPPLRPRGRYLYQLVGRALKVIELVGASKSVPEGSPRAQQLLLEDVEIARKHLGEPQYQGIRTVLRKYFASVDSDSETVWSHGDVSRSNLIQSKGELGIIDFSWKPVIPYRDLAHFIARMETDVHVSNRWIKELRAEVLSGFGIDATDLPVGFRIALVQRALRSVRKPYARTQRWGRLQLARLTHEPWGPL
jgi:hypothetical protein